MFAAKWTNEARPQYDELKERAETSLKNRKKSAKTKAAKAEGLFKQVHKIIELLSSNPKHPGSRTHEFHSLTNPYDADAKVFEAYAQNKIPGAFRVFWCYGPGTRQITISAITPHP